MGRHTRRAEQPRVPAMRDPAHDNAGQPPRIRLTALSILVVASTDDGHHTCMYREDHPPTCERCGMPLDTGGSVHGRLTMSTAGELGFVCLRH